MKHSVKDPVPLGNPPKRILVVDDHTDTRTITALILNRVGFEVFTAGSIAEARKLCDEMDFDLLLGDIGLPDGSGLELMRELDERCHVKGIAYTGYGFDSDISSARAAGFSAFLLKPVDTPILLATVSRIISDV